MEGNADFAGLYWPQLEQWAEYLKDKGFDPENQLCTDDFAGHLAHNVNLSAKAICGLGAFAKLCEMRGDKAKADEYSKLAREFAAALGEGSRRRRPFPPRLRQARHLEPEIQPDLGPHPRPEPLPGRGRCGRKWTIYRKIQNKYGLPLDNRETYTKLDWITWTATLTQNRADFEALIDPIFPFLNETPDRSPLTDWYSDQDRAERSASPPGR